MNEQNNGKLVYLIEKIWTDSLENEISAAVGYEPFGFMVNEEAAKNFCAKGRLYKQKDCWAIRDSLPEYRYKPVKQVEQ